MTSVTSQTPTETTADSKTAHIDDSGSDLLPEYYVLAGHLGGVARWEAFADEWDGALAHGPRGKRLEYFKMREADRLEDQFQGWTAEERDGKVGQLTRIIREYAECDIVCAMSKRDYDLFMRGRAFPYPRDSPYYYLFITLIFDVLRRERLRPEPRKIDFVFDRQLNIEVVAREVRKEMELFIRTPFARRIVGDQGVSLLGDVTFGADKDIRPLQAADLLAWSEHRRRESPLESPPGCLSELPLAERVERDVPPYLMTWTTKISGEVLRLNYPETQPRRPRT